MVDDRWAMAPGGWSRLMLAFLTPGPTVDGRRVDGSMAHVRGAAALLGEEFAFREPNSWLRWWPLGQLYPQASFGVAKGPMRCL
jgi:hypothetical protein